jgi:hypothetical protein
MHFSLWHNAAWQRQQPGQLVKTKYVLSFFSSFLLSLPFQHQINNNKRLIGFHHYYPFLFLFLSLALLLLVTGEGKVDLGLVQRSNPRWLQTALNTLLQLGAR